MNPNHNYAPAPPTYPAVLRSPVGLGVAACVLLWIVVAVDVLSLVAGGYLYGLLAGVPRSGAAPDAVAGLDGRQVVYDLVGLVQSLLFLATGVVCICWLYRLRDNAEIFAPGMHRQKRGWTGWGWVVPVVNLWFPRRITVDIWDASLPAGPYAPARPGHGLIDLWWGLWLAEGFFALAGSGLYEGAESIGEMNRALGLLSLSDVLDIGCAVLAVRLVRVLTRMQDVKAWQGPVPVPG